MATENIITLPNINTNAKTRKPMRADTFGRDRVAQKKLGHVVARRFAPVELPLMVQQRQGRRGE
jgi:hypothetical protein